jgi:3-hydroxyacyl-[acyl-carrier-protein] dehydratase
VGSNPDILGAIPHRPPFLWVDSIVSFDARTIVTEKFIAPDLDFFKGHYPGYPIMPGVLLCEAVFQTGALFMAKMLGKREVKPGDTIRMHVTLAENIGNVWFFKGKILVDNRTAVKVDFGCAITDTD